MRTKMEIAEREDKLLGDMLGIIRFTEVVSAKLHRVLDEAKIYQVVTEEFAKSDHYSASILLLTDDDTSLQLAETSIAPSKLEVLEKASGMKAKEYRIKLSKSGIYTQVVREGKTVHANVSDIIREFLPRPLAYLISKTMGYEKQFSILAPLHKHGKIGGVLTVSCADSCEYFTHSVENLALHISTALELAHKNAQRNRALQALKRYHDHLGELVEERAGELKTVNEKLLAEITERKLAEEALIKIEQERSAILNSMSELMVYQDTEHRVLWTNKVAAESVALSIEQLLGRHCYEIWHRRDKPCAGCPVAKARETGKPQEAEMTTPDGRVWFVRGYPIRDANENLVGMVEVTLDITARQRAEQALADEVTRRRILVDQSLDGIVVLDEDARVYEANQRFAEMLGYTPEEVRELHTWDWDKNFPPEKLLEMGRAVDEKGLRLETQHHRKDGSVIDVDISINGAMCGGQKLIFCVCRDITERKQAEEALRESREKLQKMFESVTDAISVVDLNGVIIDVNQRTVEMHGFTSKAELLGKNALEMVAPQDRQRIAANMRKAIKEGAVRGVEYTLPKADGTEFPGELSTSVLRDASGKPVAHITIARDITARKRMEEVLRESEERFRSMVENSQVGIMILDDAYRFAYVNDELCRISGYSRKEVIGQDFRKFLDEESRQLVAERYIRRQRGEEVPPRYEFNIVRKDGQKRRVEISSAVIRDSAGAVKTVAQILDITERRQSEERLKLLGSVTQQVSDATLVTDLSFNITYVNKAAEDLFGYSAEEMLGKHMDTFNVEPLPKSQKQEVVRTASSGGPWVGTVVKRRKDGSTFLSECHISPLHDREGQISSYIDVLRDVTERRQAEEALRESQKFSSSLLESSPTPINVIDLDTSIRYVNPAFEKLTGFNLAEIAGMKAPHPWWPEGKRKLIVAALKDSVEHGGRRSGTERMFQKKNGEHFWVTFSSAPVMQEGKPVYLIVNWLDITERKRAAEKEKQLQQELYLAQRLAAVGELAAGVAHEINNPLTGVLGFSQRLMRKSTDKEVSRDLEIIHDEARRAADVVQNLLTFARRRQPKKEYTNINDIVRRTLELRSYALQTSNIEVVTALAHSLPQVMVDFPQIQEVFLNIILNAEQAMSEAHGRGKLVIKTQRVKDQVRISFADGGPGIARENLDKVFDPFFTTRGERGGTGLGLSACHGIVTEHGGRIYVRSKPGEGATFIVELPLSPVETTVAHQS